MDDMLSIRIGANLSLAKRGKNTNKSLQLELPKRPKITTLLHLQESE